MVPNIVQTMLTSSRDKYHVTVIRGDPGSGRGGGERVALTLYLKQPGPPSDSECRIQGPLTGGSRFLMSILRNGNVALSNLRNSPVTLSILRNDHVACHYLLKAHVACH